MEKGRNCSSGAISPLSTIFCYLTLNFYVNTRIRFSLRDKRLFEITEVEITRVDCIWTLWSATDYLRIHFSAIQMYFCICICKVNLKLLISRNKLFLVPENMNCDIRSLRLQKLKCTETYKMCPHFILCYTRVYFEISRSLRYRDSTVILLFSALASGIL